MSAAAPATQLPRPGDIVGGKYVIDRLIGQGGMGAVFAAKHRKLGQSVAIKVMLADPSNPEAAHRFINEARAAANIQNEHVVRVDDVDEEMGYAFMVLELLEGEDLAQVLEREQRVAPHLVVNYLLQALKGVGQAHALGFVHRDLKPSNLFLAKRKDGSSIIKVLDFGISKASNAGALGQSPSSLTSTKAMLGSPLYMSPEQLRSSKSVDQRADIWAIGVILFELLTGTLPFMGENLGELFAAILETDPPGVRQRAPNVPADLEAVVTRCLQRRPENRFQTVAELVQALSAVNLQASTMALNAPNALAGTALLGQSPMQPGIPYGTPNNLAAMGTGAGPHGPGPIGNLTPQGAVRPHASTGSGMHAMHAQPPMQPPGIGAVTPQPSSGLPVAVTNSSWQTTGGTSSAPRSKTPIILGAVFGALAIVGVTAGAIAVSRRSAPPVGSSTVATSAPPPTAEVPPTASVAASATAQPSAQASASAPIASAAPNEASGAGTPTTAANHPPTTPTPKGGGHHSAPPKVDPPKVDPPKVDPPKVDPPKTPPPKPTASSKVQELR